MELVIKSQEEWNVEDCQSKWQKSDTEDLPFRLDEPSEKGLRKQRREVRREERRERREERRLKRELKRVKCSKANVDEEESLKGNEIFQVQISGLHQPQPLNSLNDLQPLNNVDIRHSRLSILSNTNSQKTQVNTNKMEQRAGIGSEDSKSVNFKKSALQNQNHNGAHPSKSKSLSEIGEKKINLNEILFTGISTFRKMETNSQITELLCTCHRWDFDILALEMLSNQNPLVLLGMKFFERFSVAQHLKTEYSILLNWLLLIESNYHSVNSYHNSTHAADVLQATAFNLSTPRLKKSLAPLDAVVSLIAAIAHDVDHPGKTSTFLCNTSHRLSLLYNDINVLENHHCAKAFLLTLSSDKVNIFKGLDTATYQKVRKSMIDMILATDMSEHQEHLTKFIQAFPNERSSQSGHVGHSGHPSPSHSAENHKFEVPNHKLEQLSEDDKFRYLKGMLIKVCDVSNPTRPMRLSRIWAERVAEEYFQQTAQEIELKLSLSMPFFQRETCSLPKTQIGFMDFIIFPMFKVWNDYVGAPELTKHLLVNYNEWKDEESKKKV